MTAVLIAISVVLGAAWIPIFLKFLRAWRARHNPVSLAICGIILLSIYTNILALAVYAFDGNPTWAAIATHVLNACICGNFYLSFVWSNKRFPEARN